jgi:hypothetical protein
MSIDFQQVREQVRQWGEGAPARAQQLQQRRAAALKLLADCAHDLDRLRSRVERVVNRDDPALRCALPVSEPLDACGPLPALPTSATLLAADGSQINPDRNAAVEFCLINVGAIAMRSGAAEPPAPAIRSRLLYDDQLYTETGSITDALVALRRDLAERQALLDLAAQAQPPVITFTDGPMELWGAKDEEGASEFQQSLQTYLSVLSRLQEMDVTTAGYVDKPGANLVVRLLEVMATPDDRLSNIRKEHPLRGVTDIDLFQEMLQPGDRSAVFALQSKSAEHYRGGLALHFFYLNVGRQGRPWLARVEIPGWVAVDPSRLDALQAVLFHQGKIMGGRPYPYLLHRAHETAIVTFEEKEQLTQMVVLELRRRGVPVGELSYKQAAKELAGRTRLGP